MVEFLQLLLEEEGRLQYAVCRNRGSVARKGNVDSANELCFLSMNQRRQSSQLLLCKPSSHKPRDSNTMSCFQHLLQQNTRDSNSTSGLTTGKTSAYLVQRPDDSKRGMRIFTIEPKTLKGLHKNHPQSCYSYNSYLRLLAHRGVALQCLPDLEHCPSPSLAPAFSNT